MGRIVGRRVDGRVRHSRQCMHVNSDPVRFSFRYTLRLWELREQLRARAVLVEIGGLWGRRIADGTT